MPQARQRDKDKGPTLVVTIVSDNPETLDGLQSYFERAGVGAFGTRAIARPEAFARESSAVVFFPDDFPPEEVARALGQLRRARPMVLTILVTGDPRRFESITAPEGKGLPAVIIPKPAWGWRILDTIRGHLDVSR